jgi:hypothetical protein
MPAKCILTIATLGLIVSFASGGAGPVPDAEVAAMIANYRQRAASETPAPEVSEDVTDPFAGVPWLDTFDGLECPKFSVVDPSLMAQQGTWLAMGAALEDDAEAKPGASSAGDLAKKSQNPISDLISLPFQNNFNFGAGPRKDVQNVLNIQPVIPFKLNADWNLIARAIVPIISNPAPGVHTGDRTGLGDVQLAAFLSPTKSKLIWGVGPVIRVPVATDDILGSGKYSGGPTAVLLTIDGPWVAGGLVQNVWSFAGDGDRGHVNEFLLQPFLNYNLPDGWYLSTGPIITANWAADSSDRWTVPVGGGIGKVLKIGSQPINVSLKTYYNVVRPTNAGDWSIQFQLMFLFPN